MKVKVPVFLIVVFLVGCYSSAQEKVERQHRIKKSQFPSEALALITQNSTELKRLKFYREVDTAQKTYTAKFKKSRLFYEIDFDQNGEFKSIAFNVKQVDVLEDSYQNIKEYLSQNFEKAKIRKMLQQYRKGIDDDSEKIIKNAFQNIINNTISYRLLIRAKKDGNSADYKITFNSDGEFEQLQKALPANYDRVLY